MRIMVTNDDGIESLGLHELARALRPLGDVVVACPDVEYSGASAAVGALNLLRPEIRRGHIEGVDEVWTLNGPPALCVMFAHLGAFGEPIDLVVSGINPGANVGRSVYHSGTVGAAVTARNYGITGVAVSQEVTIGSIEGQAWDEMLGSMLWPTAARVGAEVVRGIIEHPPADPSAVNVNVPNLPLEQLKGWRHTELAMRPMRSFSRLEKTPKPGYADSYYLKPQWGERLEVPEHCDAGAVEAGYVSITWLSPVHHLSPEPGNGAEQALDELLGPEVQA